MYIYVYKHISYVYVHMCICNVYIYIYTYLVSHPSWKLGYIIHTTYKSYNWTVPLCPTCDWSELTHSLCGMSQQVHL